MRRQLVPGPVVRLTVIKAKTRPGIEARSQSAAGAIIQASTLVTLFHCSWYIQLLYTAFYFSDPVPSFSWYRITSVISNACASSVQATFCSLLLDKGALTPKAVTIKSTNLLCGGYSCCKRSARASR